MRQKAGALSLGLGLGLGLLMLGPAGCQSPGKQVVKTEVSKGQPGYQLGLQAIACWFGGFWADAEGYAAPQRRAVTQRRCADLTLLVFGDDAREEALRELGPAEVAAVAKKAAEQSEPDRAAQGAAVSDAAQIGRLVQLVADAQREALLARRAARNMRRDRRQDLVEQPPEPLTPEEAEAAKVLRTHAALEALLHADVGPYTADARALGLMVAIHRMESLHGLNRRLRMFALEGPGHLVFGALPPPDEKSEPGAYQPGALLERLVVLAQAAGHGVPDSVTRPTDRHMLAWNGVLKGFADKLRVEVPRLSPAAAVTLRRIIESQIHELDRDYQNALRILKLG